MRKLATIATIDKLEPIPNADRILKATVRGWECVVSKSDNFNVGDEVIFIEVDSILPPRPEFAFMKDRKYRVKTIKLRKQVSQGLILPKYFVKGNYSVGDDVTKVLGITKYDPQAEIEKKTLKTISPRNPLLKFMFRFKWFRKLYGKFVVQNCSFPTDIADRTDESRLQNIPEKFKEWQHKKTRFYLTEKIDGCSSTYFTHKGKFGVCSRNVWLRREDNSAYWEIERRYNISDVLKDLAEEFGSDHIVIQGEIIGQNIQGNKYHISGYEFFVFNIIVNELRLDQKAIETICKNHGLNTVPCLYTDFALPSTINELVDFSKGKSRLNESTDREGFVIRNYKDNISFKVINPDFLLKNEE